MTEWAAVARRPEVLLNERKTNAFVFRRDSRVGTPTRRKLVLEVAILNVRSGQSESFEAAFAEAEHIIAAASGYRRHELRRCVEHSDRYILLVWWDTIESHTIGFRGSPPYQEWKHLLHHFYEPFPEVEHYLALGASE